MQQAESRSYIGEVPDIVERVVLDALEDGRWDLVYLPFGKSAIGCEWVYKIKFYLRLACNFNFRLAKGGNKDQLWFSSEKKTSCMVANSGFYRKMKLYGGTVAIMPRP